MADLKIKCTAAWWFRETFYKPGSVVVVPEGTPVPQGFFVNGVEVPKKPKVPVSQLIEIQDLKEENLKLQEEILKLKRQQAPTKKAALA